MKLVKAYIQLIRLPNLLIIALTQFLIRYFIILPSYVVHEVEPHLDLFHFILLVLSTMMIAAAGYVINDYFDVRSDSINKPERLLIDTVIKRRVAMALHFTLNIFAIGLATYIGWKVGNPKLGLVHFIVAGMLWFYSSSYKKQFLVGNVIVALLSAMVILIVGFFERQIYTSFIGDNFLSMLSKGIMITLLMYALFAFLISLIREIIKDMEDIEGDHQLFSRTMPIVLGIRVTKYITLGIIVLFIFWFVKVMQSFYIKELWMFFYYCLGAILIPMLFVTYRMLIAKAGKDFHFSSQLLKVVMLMGIFSMVLFRFIPST